MRQKALHDATHAPTSQPVSRDGTPFGGGHEQKLPQTSETTSDQNREIPTERSVMLPETIHSAAIDRIGAQVDAMTNELESEARLPTRVFEDLTAAGLFRQLSTRASGQPCTPREWFANGVRAAKWDGSLGWVITQGSVMFPQVQALAPRLADALASLDDRVLVGTNAGMLTVERTSGGYRLNGRSGFCSGIDGASVVFGAGPLPDGAPTDVYMFGAPTGAWTVDRDWDPVGLRGTGSHSIVANNLEINDGWTMPLLGEPMIDDPIRVVCFSQAGAWPIAMSVAATQLGISRRALDEAYEIIATKTPAPTFDLLDTRPTVRDELMHAEGRWFQAYSAASSALELVWSEANTLDRPTDRTRAMLATAAHLANIDGADIVERVWRIAGTSALSPDHPIARCSRDVRPLLGHIACNRAVLQFAAARWRGEPAEFSLA